MTDALEAHIGELRNSDRNVRGRAALDLGARSDARAGDALIRSLCVERDPFVRENITWALVRLGDAAVTPLIQLLRDADPQIRHHAAHVLGKMRDPRALDAMIDVLRDDDATVVAKAAFGLGQLGDPRAILPLVALVGHESRELQSTLASVLERFGHSAVAPLVEALRHERWQVREQAASILGLIENADAVPALIAASADRHWQVRFACAYALGELGGQAANAAVESMYGDEDARVRSLVERYRGGRRNRSRKRC